MGAVEERGEAAVSEKEDRGWWLLGFGLAGLADIGGVGGA
jgi:hypothetical protein